MKKITKKLVSGTLLCSMLVYTLPIMAFTNEETIYSKLNSNGEVYKTIATTIFDEETTQTEINKQLPVDCEITYELDGKKITPEELSGKSGKVKIILKYTNKIKNEVEINGNNEELYTPFIVVAGTIIQNNNNKNIEITNGKIINDGSKTIVVGIAMPGMQESLNVSKEDIDIPNSIEITMESINFELGNIITYCTPKIFEEEIDLSNIDELFSKVDQLQDGINKIQDGGIELSDGVNTLKMGSDKLNSGAISLKNGTQNYTLKSKEFNNAMGQVSNGVNNLNSKYDELNNGINTLSESSKTLAQGAKAVSSGVNQFSAGIDSVNMGVVNLSAGINNIQGGVSNVQTAIDQAKTITDSLTSNGNNLGTTTSIQNAINVNNQAIATLQTVNTALQAQLVVADETVVGSINDAINTNNGKIGELTNINSELESNKNAILRASTNTQAISNLQALLAGAQNGMSQVAGGIHTIKGGVSNLSTGIGELANKKGDLMEGAKQVSIGTDALVSGAQSLSSGSGQVKSGLNTLNVSTNQLASANNQLTDAAFTISNGASDLANGTLELDNGVVKLSKGSGELVNGIKQFNNDGISKISNEINGNVKNVIKRIEKLEDLSSQYNTFVSDESRDSIKFISIINNIKNSGKEQKNEDVIINNSDVNIEKKPNENKK